MDGPLGCTPGSNATYTRQVVRFRESSPVEGCEPRIVSEECPCHEAAQSGCPLSTARDGDGTVAVEFTHQTCTSGCGGDVRDGDVVGVGEERVRFASPMAQQCRSQTQIHARSICRGIGGSHVLGNIVPMFEWCVADDTMRRCLHHIETFLFTNCTAMAVMAVAPSPWAPPVPAVASPPSIPPVVETRPIDVDNDHTRIYILAIALPLLVASVSACGMYLYRRRGQI